MDRIASVHLIGFKGLDRDYVLDGPTILSGKNGVGKSAAIEGLRYAMTGAVPGGRKLDAVAALFPPRGGSVRVLDSAGRWIERGIVRDAAKAKVSEILATSDDKEGEDPDLSAWAVSEVVLDIQAFLALSAEKRREFVLRLCGGGTAPEDLGESLALEYAREVAGKGATTGWLAGADDPLAHAWRRPRGLREVLASLLGAAATEKSLSELFLRLTETAKERRLGARAAALEATAAIRELEAEAQGARAAAAEIDEKRKAYEKAQEEFSAYRARAARRDEARQRRDGAAKAHDAALAALDGAQKLAAVAAPPGERPVPPAGDPRREETLAAIGSNLGQQQAIRKTQREYEQLIEIEERTGNQITEAEDAFRRHEKLPLRRVTLLLEEIPDEADPSLPELRAAVREVTKGFNAETVALERRAEEAAEAHRKAWEAARGARDGQLEAIAKLEELARAQGEDRKRLSELEAGTSAGDADHRRRLAAWETSNETYRAAGERLRGAQATMDRARAELADAAKRVEAVEGVNAEAFSGLDAMEMKVIQARDALQAAEAAAGAVKAYAAATERAKQNFFDERGWKAAESAIKTLREKVVGDSTARLVPDVQKVLQAAGRSEIFFLDTENERGRPIFSLGWIKDEAKVPLEALSGGEAAIFLAALRVSLTLRSLGRKVLLIEGDGLDAKNFAGLLQALRPQSEKLEAVIVATSRQELGSTDGWNVIQLG